MKDFNYYAPTEVEFGREAEDRIGRLVGKYGGTRVLVHYGGRSAERSGLLDKVCDRLRDAGVEFFRLGGVVPNPRLSKVHEGIDLCRREGIDFIVAVGGGSVIDSAKAIAYGVPYDGEVWDFYAGKAKPRTALPVGVVLTIPASGSEMSDSSVITNEDGDVKLGYSNDICRPRFAVMNPERTFTLPAYQTACGATDIMMHTMERYFSHETDMDITDALAEGLIRTVMESAAEVLRDPENYRHRAQLMWAGSLSHNDLTGCGLAGDWATHRLEHELSALFDVAHGAGLAAVWGSWARYVYRENVARFAQYAVNVMGVGNDFQSPERTALKGIEATERFFRSIGMPTSIRELIGREVTDGEIAEMVRKCSRNGTVALGRFKVLAPEDMAAIYRMAR